MSEEIHIEKLEGINKEELETVTFEEIQRPKVFKAPTEQEPEVSFDFVLHSMNVKVIKNKQSKMGTQDLYILDSLPEIYSYRNAVKQLETFLKKEKVKLPANIEYVTREGSSFDTKYIFKVVKG